MINNEELNKMYLNLFSKIWDLQKEVNLLKEKINNIQKEVEDRYNGNKWIYTIGNRDMRRGTTYGSRRRNWHTK